MDAIYEIQAETIKTLANARRLEIIHILATGPREVGRLAAEIGVSQPNVSQHLAVMKAAGIVEAERFGREIHYRLADPDVVAACDLMRGVLRRRLARLASLSDPVAATAPTATAPTTTEPTTTKAAAEPPLATLSR
jgi:ArsR family transcriptional regulator